MIEYIRVDYLRPDTIRLIEYGLNILDAINRLSGGDISTRYTPKNATAHVVFGEPIDASAVFDTAISRKAGGARLDGMIRDSLSELSNGLEQHL